MLIYLGTWTLSAPPNAEEITDQYGLKFKQCSYNWWDHSLAIGEVLFLAWGIRVCYNVRHAESMYNEARLISYAIYNIALVNTTMVAFHLFIFPQAGPDIKYLLGFIRTQLSTSVTVALVFGPKVVRVLRGQGDQWDNKARVRGVTASFSLNGIGLVPEDTPDLYQENEELKEEVQKLAAQIEFMRIVNMEMNNRHLKPKPGGYFTLTSSLQSPLCKASSSQSQSIKQMTSHVNNATISDDGHSGSNSVGTNSIGLFIFPQAGPDIKYLLGFIRTQLSTSVTVALVFGPKVVRVLRGQGDQWDNKARVRGVTASFSLNGIGLVPEDTPDLYQENEELKEEVQKLAAQIEFMRIVNMEMNNRHLKPKPGGYFTLTSSLQSPLCKASSSQSQSIKQMTSHVNNATISDDGHSGSNSVGTNSIGYTKNNTFSDSERAKLAKLLVEKEFSSWQNVHGDASVLKFKISSQRFQELAKLIEQTFPGENSLTYFIPYNKITKSSPSGKLYWQYNNWRQALKDIVPQASTEIEDFEANVNQSCLGVDHNYPAAPSHTTSGQINSSDRV
uniref:G-protein coupled receptors family 3 profile domain-containing protein n=1 Tax=Lutzomyia longipalpis TaxID=7200 RepID=A0A1B0CB02_LUTLO